MAHKEFFFALYDHLKQLKEENIMAYMCRRRLQETQAELERTGNSGTPEDLRGNSR